VVHRSLNLFGLSFFRVPFSSFFLFFGSNSASVRRHESVLLPYELMDRVFASKGYWHDLVEAGPMVRCLSADEGAALLGDVMCVWHDTYMCAWHDSFVCV